MAYYGFLFVFFTSGLLAQAMWQHGAIRYVPFLMLALFSGLRYEVGVDYESYERIFYAIGSGERTYVEWAYWALNWLISRIDGTPQLVFLVMALATNTLFFAAIDRQTHSFWLAALLYLSVGPLFLNSMNQIRQALTISAFAYSLRYIISGELLKYALVISIAALFHWSALIFLPLYFLRHFRPTWRTLALTLAGALAFGVFFEEIILESRYSIYLRRGDRSVSMLLTTLFLVLSAILLSLRSYFGKRNRAAYLYLNLMAISFALIVTVISTDLIRGALYRLNNYFIFAYLVLVSELPGIMRHKQERTIVAYLIGIAALFYFAYALGVHGGDNQLVPYSMRLKLIQ